MLRVGDRVHKWSELNLVGTVEKVFESNSKTWFTGGTSSRRLIASVRYNKDKVVDIPVNELMILERK